MDFRDFWMKVDLYRWLPRVLIGEYNYVRDHIALKPNIIGEVYCPSAIRDRIGSIDVLKLADLGMNAMSSGKMMLEVREGDPTEPCEHFFQACFWHQGGEFAFERVVTNSRYYNTAREEDKNKKTVGQMIEWVRAQSGILDAAVRVHCRSSPQGPPIPKSGIGCAHYVRALLDQKILDVYSYEVYLPPLEWRQ